MLAMQTGPVFPLKFDGIIQTIAIIRTKHIFIPSGVDWIFIVIHGLTLPLVQLHGIRVS